ncbi:MAG: two-component sensor histidine kinase [Tepidisphaera sp.]|nr:two-component sensor histidine kinase [Tepidisphaera sp.]
MLWGYLLIGLGLGAIIAWVVGRAQLRRSAAKAQAAERRAAAAQRLAELGAMTSGLAHEIKNPLSTIGLNAQLLAEGVDELASGQPIDPDAKQRLVRRVGSLRREVERLRGILTDFLAYAGELRLDQKPTDLNKVVDELADFFLPQAEQSKVRLRVDLSPEPLVASLDTGHIKQAVLNLMLNAVQAFPAAAPGSDTSQPRDLMLRTFASNDADRRETVTLTITDTGPGIPADVLPRIFTPYFTTKAGGSGLGLPTTRRIIEAHHGRLDVVSEPGRGTSFTMVLPRAESPIHAEESHDSPRPTRA